MPWLPLSKPYINSSVGTGSKSVRHLVNTAVEFRPKEYICWLKFNSWCTQIVLQQTFLHLIIVELTIISRYLPTKHPQLITCYPTLDKTSSSRISLVGMLSAHLISSVNSSKFGLSESQPTLLWSYSLKIMIGKEEQTKICVL